MGVDLTVDTLKTFIQTISGSDEKIVVLKGFPLALLGEEKNRVNLTIMVDSAFPYFTENIYNKRNIITYEEFVFLYPFIKSSYKEIVVINNNFYINSVPISTPLSDDIEESLLLQFADIDEEEDQDDYHIGDLSKYLEIFSGVKRTNDILFGVYNDEHIWQMPDPKLKMIDYFEGEKTDHLNYSDEIEEFRNLVTEEDYIELVKYIMAKPDKVYVKIDNYLSDKEELHEKLQLIAANWQDWTEIVICKATEKQPAYTSDPRYKEILKKYWNSESFVELKVYDLAELNAGKKELITVSQEQIIDNIVTEVEKCNRGDTDFRDVFVTAPTGSGKSAMFQIPAIHLAEEHKLLTLVISPLIGLMTDQVKNLELMKYPYAETINSDISPIVKQDIINKVSNGNLHILYLSPETLLSRSDVEQLIGEREIGMVVIDEAHIVTTWGKQFRPDYWYLGSHIQKLRKRQREKYGKFFVIASFTATAIHGGIEDMYQETVNSLNMLQPITYLGYVKRDDIDIRIIKKEVGKGRDEYEFDKFENLLEEGVKRAAITNKKTLIYFPTVGLINRFFDYCQAKKMSKNIAQYYGALDKDKKRENYESFRDGKKNVMLATKAFGMGIDINDIELVIHFAPTGNVCDYVQEIGRGARRRDLQGEAYYNFASQDFKHINRLHGLSTIQKYQLIEVISKVEELYRLHLQSPDGSAVTRRKNAMLVDAENFSYIFGRENMEEGENINKVKTALLLIQKDFENTLGFSPLYVRPIPLFAIGFFAIVPDIQKKLRKEYPNCLDVIDEKENICRVNLNQIWKRHYQNISFPMFKYCIYAESDKIDFSSKFKMTPALSVEVELARDYLRQFNAIWGCIKSVISESVQTGKFLSEEAIIEIISEKTGVSQYKAQSIIKVLIASMDMYRRDFYKGSNAIVMERVQSNGKVTYQFKVAINSYLSWVENGKDYIIGSVEDGLFYMKNTFGNDIKQYSVILGLLESFGVLTFKMLGGANSQLYIYINQIQGLQNIINNPYKYRNRLLEAVGERHTVSVEMLTYIFNSEFSSEETWNLLEDYFLGHIPEVVKGECRKKRPDMRI